MNVRISSLAAQAIMLLNEDVEELDRAQSFGDPGMELRQLAIGLVDDAVTATLLEADTDNIDESLTLDTGGAVRNADGSVDIPLPDDWLRPVEIRMEGWADVLHDYRDPRPVTRNCTLPGARLRRHNGRRILQLTGSGSNADSVPAISVEYLPSPRTGPLWSGDTNRSAYRKSDIVWLPASLLPAATRRLADMMRTIISE